MDLVIVSERRFNEALQLFADSTFLILKGESKLKTQRKSESETVEIGTKAMQMIRNQSKALSLGYVNPSDFADDTAEKQDFYDLLREAGTQLAGTSPPGPINRVSARIYRDWDAAERIYEYSFRRLAESWELTQPDDGDDDIEDLEPRIPK